MQRVTSYSASTSPAQTRRRRNKLYRACVETLEARRLLSFSPAATYAADGPRDVEVGDFNGDGHADLVTANLSAAGVQLNKGDGTFHEQVSYPMGGEHVALAVAVGDLNADGKLDVTVTTSTQRISGYYTDAYYGHEYPIYTSVGHVKVLLGNGDGTLTPSAETKDLGDGRFFSVELGDLDEDGDLDAAATNWDGGEIAVLLGDGDGTFGAPFELAAGTAPQNVDIADLNGDGNLDLVTTDLYADLKVILGNGDGTFQPAQAVPPGGDYAHGQAVGDVDGDGKLDLVVTTHVVTRVYDSYGYYTTQTEGRVTVLLGNGDGTFATGNSYWADSEALKPIELADFNGDGKLDVAAASYPAGHVNVLHGNGDGTFGAPEVLDIGAPSGGPANIVVADLTATPGPISPRRTTAGTRSPSSSMAMSRRRC